MNSITKTHFAGVALFVTAVLFAASVALATPAHAADDFYGDFSADNESGGWSDYGTANSGWSDYGIANDGWYNYGSSDNGWSDYGTANDGWYDYGSSNNGWSDYGVANDTGTFVADDSGYFTPDQTGYFTPDTTGYFTPDSTGYFTPDTNYYTPSYSYGGGSSYGYGASTIAHGTTIAYPYSNAHSTTIAYPYSNARSTVITQVVPQQTVVQQYNQPTCNLYVTSATYNGSSNIGWSTSYATSATLTDFGSVQTGSGSRVINNITSTRTYTMTVTGQGGSNTCTATIYVQQPPVVYQTPSCTLQVTPSNVTSGTYATLTWNSYNANTASITGIGTVSLSGNTTVYPSGQQTYTMTVYGYNGQTNTCSAVVYSNPVVIPPPYYPPANNLSCSLTASPSSITNGQSSYLSWTSYGATSAWLSDSIGDVSTNGSLSVRPETTRYYTLNIQDGYGHTAQCSTTVNVSGVPYVSLTQIPYTGVDFGPVGNVVYWFVLVAWAIGAGYLVVAKSGSILGFAYGIAGKSAHTTDPESMIVHEAIIDSAPETQAPVQSAQSAAGYHTDTMKLEVGQDGMPRINLVRRQA